MDALVRRLKLHRPSPSPYDPDPAAAPVPATAGDGELFRPRRAAVLVCLFRGDGGELRVILTKRSSSLSTHSGEQLLGFFFTLILFGALSLLLGGNVPMHTRGWEVGFYIGLPLVFLFLAELPFQSCGSVNSGY
jgi:hypothetical protein